MACFNENFFGTNVAGLTTGLVNGFVDRCGVGTSVAGLASVLNGSCFGPPFFVQRLASLRGVPVILCLESGRCLKGEILQVCGDYIEFNCDGSLVAIPIRQITRVQLASTGVDTVF